MNTRIGLIAGSLRRASFSRRIAAALARLAPSGYEFELISIDGLPVYNQDFDEEQNVPSSYIAFRKVIAEMEGVIFVTPEHNRSIPAALKNALDVASRPYGSNLWDGKPGAVVSNSPGNIAAFGAHHHLRQCLVFLNVPVLQQPEVYLAEADKLIGEDGNFAEESTQEFMQEFVDTYITWFERNREIN